MTKTPGQDEYPHDIPHDIPHDLPQWLYVTAPDDAEAHTIARTLVAERLAACANVLGAMRSYYWWDGEVQSGAEVALVLKTKRSRVAAATQRIQVLHSAECPCVVALDITGGHAPFLDWIVKETS